MITRRSRLSALAAALLIPLAGCSFDDQPGGFDRLITGLTSGGSQVPATGASKMLQDPEGQLQDNGIEVVASSQTHAENLCQDIAAARSDAQTIVTCLGCRMRTRTTGKFVCTLRTEYVPLPPQKP